MHCQRPSNEFSRVTSFNVTYILNRRLLVHCGGVSKGICVVLHSLPCTIQPFVSFSSMTQLCLKTKDEEENSNANCKSTRIICEITRECIWLYTVMNLSCLTLFYVELTSSTTTGFKFWTIWGLQLMATWTKGNSNERRVKYCQERRLSTCQSLIILQSLRFRYTLTQSCHCLLQVHWVRVRQKIFEHF